MTDDIEGAALRHRYSEAKRLWYFALLVQAGLIVSPAVVTLLQVPWVAYLGMLLALAGGVVLFFLHVAADRSFEKAEHLRRHRLLANGLGTSVPVGVAMGVIAQPPTRPSPDPPPAPQGKYYNSPVDPSPARLVHILWESAHCTQYLCSRASLHAAWAAVTGGVVVVAAFVSALWFGIDAPFGVRVATGGTALFGVFGFGSFAKLWHSFAGTASSAKEVCASSEALLQQNALDLATAIGVLEDYNVALGRAAPIPSYIWRSMQKPLADSWELAKRAQTPPLSQPGTAR